MKPDWDESAYDDLADIWVAATVDDRAAIERAVLRANRLLTEDPENEGESRSGNVRVLFAPPLVVWYRVQPGPRARVVNVRRFRTQA